LFSNVIVFPIAGSKKAAGIFIEENENKKRPAIICRSFL